VGRLHVKGRFRPGLIEVIGTEAPAGEPAKQFHTVTWAQMKAYITHGDTRYDELRSVPDGA
jgi:hypothetical protein